MAETLDVAARLAEGRPAVDNIGDYVWACHQLGYQHPDLTLHAGQVRDWYSTEDGLDLRALDADCAALETVVAAADSALRLQDEQLGALAGAWQGGGGDASREFLRRHGEASGVAAAALCNAADALTALRDELWNAVDEKVTAAVAIDDRRRAERGEWLAATRTITTGAGDRAVASELIDQQVKPFVDNDIRSAWLTAMQTTMASVAAAFDAATAALTAEPSAMFEVPGDLGPYDTPQPGGAPPTEAAGTASAAWTSPAPAAGPATAPAPAFPAAPPPAFPAAPPPAFPTAPPQAPTAPMPAPAPAASAPPPMPTMPTMPSLGDLGGLSGLGQQLADTIGGLLNQPNNALPDPPKLDDPAPLDEEPLPDDGAKDHKAAQEEDHAKDETAKETDDLTEPSDGCQDEPADEPSPADPPPPEPAPTPAPVPPPPPPAPMPPPPEPVGTETPCEIVADELPQAGP